MDVDDQNKSYLDRILAAAQRAVSDKKTTPDAAVEERVKESLFRLEVILTYVDQIPQAWVRLIKVHMGDAIGLSAAGRLVTLLNERGIRTSDSQMQDHDGSRSYCANVADMRKKVGC